MSRLPKPHKLSNVSWKGCVQVPMEGCKGFVHLEGHVPMKGVCMKGCVTIEGVCTYMYGRKQCVPI